MPNRDTPPLTRGLVLRGVGFALAIVLGGIAVWLIVTSTTQKRIEIGVLTGLWGLLLGAYSMFGSRRPMAHYGEDAYDVPPPSAALEVRSAPSALERAEAAAERRAFQAGLEQLLHREIRTAVSLEVGELRSEIAALRSELLEKVGGQIRLERIETTRVIGSDLEALQHEVRQLKAVREATLAAAPASSIVNLAVSTGSPGAGSSAEPFLTRLLPAPPVRPAEPVQPVQPVPPVQPVQVEPVPPVRPVVPEPVEPEPVEPEPVEPEPVAAVVEPVEPEPATAPLSPGDPFAGLPRIRPFTEFALDPIEAAAAPEPEPTAAPHRPSAPSTPRRHRRADESNAGQELLAKLLAREGS